MDFLSVCGENPPEVKKYHVVACTSRLASVLSLLTDVSASYTKNNMCIQQFIRKAILLFLFSTAVTPAFAVIRDGGVDPSNLGQGGWLYIMSDATNKLGGNVASVTNESSLFAYMKHIGFNYVIVKAGTSNTLWNGSYSSPQFTAALVSSAHANGLLIFGSNRSWGNDNPGEVAVADYIFNQGADGFVWDAEAEWESGNPGSPTVPRRHGICA